MTTSHGDWLQSLRYRLASHALATMQGAQRPWLMLVYRAFKSDHAAWKHKHLALQGIASELGGECSALFALSARSLAEIHLLHKGESEHIDDLDEQLAECRARLISLRARGAPIGGQRVSQLAQSTNRSANLATSESAAGITGASGRAPLWRSTPGRNRGKENTIPPLTESASPTVSLLRAGLSSDTVPVAAVPINPLLRSLLKEVADAQTAGAAGAGYDAAKALRCRKALLSGNGADLQLET